jgi:6-phosphofructokinase 1
LTADRFDNPSRYAVVLVSEGATFKDANDMVYQEHEADAYGHKKLGGIGKIVGNKLKELSPKYNRYNKQINITQQKLGYLTRCGAPDAIDSEVPTVYGNLALDLILRGIHGRLVNLKNGNYGDIPIDVVSSKDKKVNVEKFYNTERLRPHYKNFQGKPFFVITGD